MRFNTRRSFTLIEMVTYISLVGVSVTLLVSFEMATQQSITSQKRACNISAQAGAAFQQLHEDLSRATKVTISKDNKTLTIEHGTTKITYQPKTSLHSKNAEMLVRIQEDPKSKLLFEQPYPRLSACLFKRDKTFIRAHASFIRARWGKIKASTTSFDWTFEPIVDSARTP